MTVSPPPGAQPMPDADAGAAAPASAPGLAARGLGLVLSALVIWSIGFALLDEANARFGAIAFGFALTLAAAPLADRMPPRMRLLGWAIDGTLVAAFAWSAWWFFAIKQQLWTGFYIADPTNIAAGFAGLVCILEAVRRAWGWSLVILACAFVAFGFAGPWLPGALEHWGMDAGSFMQIAWYSFDGVFGRTTGLVADTVLIFLIFGAMLENTGAGESLIRISTALTARITGGAAHAAIVASAIFGMMSGSVAANIAGTGVFTIPMIKRQGFSPKFAAAVETAASSGGQLTPPIMAAAVFVMADLVGRPYAMIIAAAALPALFKYLSLFAQVYAEAVRLDLRPLPEDQIPKLTRRDWLNALLVVVPIAALMAAFLSGYSPSMSGLLGLLAAVIAGLVLNPEFRRRPAKILDALASGGIASGQIMIAVAAIGIVMAVVNETGVAIRFATEIASVGDGFLPGALLLAAMGALILGMGLPTLAAYLIIAIMIAPALIKAGVDPLAAHMFVLYFAVYSSLVPPIAYGCYVAAPIAGANPLATSFTALRLSVVGLLVPFVFVYSPSLLLITDDFSWTGLAGACLRLTAAIWMFASAFGGGDPIVGRTSPASRVARTAAGAAALVPVVWISAAGVIAAAGLIAWSLRARGASRALA